MTSDDLYTLFRSDVVDTVAPYLWTDTEVWNYMNDAYRTFVRLIGGIPDSMSSLTQVAIKTGGATSAVSPLILRFNNAYLLSDGTNLKIINSANTPQFNATDYGNTMTSQRNTTAGPVRYMITNAGRNKDAGYVRWAKIPQKDDTVQLDVYRLPLDVVTTGFEFDEVGEEHHEAFLLWMKARAYGKADTETFDRGRRDDNMKLFRDYCADAKAENRRYKSHVMTAAYGGL
jgi:hypothetical protein